MASPIRTKITNISNRLLVYDLGANGTVSLTPAGTRCDATVLEGDIFSMFRSGRHAEQLILAVANNWVSLEYFIEAAYKVTPVTTRSMTMVGAVAKQYDPWFANKMADNDDSAEQQEPQQEPQEQQQEQQEQVPDNQETTEAAGVAANAPESAAAESLSDSGAEANTEPADEEQAAEETAPQEQLSAEAEDPEDPEEVEAVATETSEPNTAEVVAEGVVAVKQRTRSKRNIKTN